MAKRVGISLLGTDGAGVSDFGDIDAGFWARSNFGGCIHLMSIVLYFLLHVREVGAIAMYCWCSFVCRSRFGFTYKILPEFGSSLINRDSVSDDLGRGPSSVWKLVALHPSSLKPRD
jgi:hypothetical protein